MNILKSMVLIAVVAWTFSLGCHLQDVNNDGRIHIAFIGDSTSVFYAPYQWLGYPYIVREMLNHRYSLYDVTVNAQPGATVTTGFLWYNFPSMLSQTLSDHPDAVVIAGGTNDAIHGVPASTYFAGIMALKGQVEATGAFPVIALTPRILEPGAGQYPAANALIEDYNSLVSGSLPSIQVIGLNQVDPDQTDGIHFSPDAQLERAIIAFKNLTDDPSAPPVDPWELFNTLAGY